MTERRIYLDGVKLFSTTGNSSGKAGSFLTPAGVHEMWCKMLDMKHEERLKEAHDLVERSLFDCYDNEGSGPDSISITGDTRPRHNLDAAVLRYKELKRKGPSHPECPFPVEVKDGT